MAGQRLGEDHDVTHARALRARVPQVVEGELVGSKNDLGDAVDKNDKGFEKYFPYVAEPTSGSRGELAKAAGSSTKSALGDALTSSDSSNTTLIAGSAAAGAAGVLLIGTAFGWWRRRMQRPY